MTGKSYPLIGISKGLTLKKFLIVSLAALLSASAAQAGTLLNGGFEDADLSPFAVSSSLYLGRTGFFEGVPEGTFIGTVGFLEIGVVGTVSQVFNLATAGTFGLSFYVGKVEFACGCNDVPLTFRALIDGTELVNGVPPAVSSVYRATQFVFHDVQTDLLAGDHTLAFEFSRGATGFGRAPEFGLDGIQSTFSPAVAGVPEPSAWALLILGFGVIGARLRRRRPRAALIFA